MKIDDNDFYITTQLAEIDVPWVIEHLRQTYWGSWRDDACITESLRNSLCFGLFERQLLPKVEHGKSHNDFQVGFGRVVTDYATIAYFCDIYIKDEYQDRGLGRFLVQTMMDDPRISKLAMLLRTRPTTAAFYKKLLKIAHPGSTSWDWTGVEEAFKNSELAMMPEWHEFAGDLETVLRGRVGYAPLPTGPVRSANLWGGTGIGVNINASPEVQKAAWLFLVWATSPETQLAGLTGKVSGGTPTRTSVYEMPDVKKNSHEPTTMPNMLTADTMQIAWDPKHIGLRPKIPQWNEADTVVFTNLSKMLAGELSSEDAMKTTKQRIDQIVGA